jgi:hypothetical protein
MARCVADFVDDPEGGNGMLPLMGVVPDMKADSNRYILIQNWYPSLCQIEIVIVINFVRIWRM